MAAGNGRGRDAVSLWSQRGGRGGGDRRPAGRGLTPAALSARILQLVPQLLEGPALEVVARDDL